MRSKFGWILGAAALVAALAGCGKAPPPPLALPPPIPQTNGGFGGGMGAVNCGGVMGQYPFSQTPFYGSLTGTTSYSSSTGNSISLTLGYQSFMTGASSYQNVVGSALLNLPDLQQATTGYPGQQPNMQIPYQFCVTSVPTSGGQPFPGTYAPQDQSIAMTMYGYVQSPMFTVNPYDPYSSPYGGTQYTQTPVTVSIGQSAYGGCGAYLNQGRVFGCIEVKVGNNGQPRRYNAR